MKIGLDVGSTTIKCVVIDDNDQLIYKSYNRHYSHIVESAAKELGKLRETVDGVVSLSVSGSAGLGFATHCGLPFVQEVFATRIAVGKLHPEADVVIELGGEDAKILFLTGGLEARMNGSCAGGTGAFIDQMATLLKTDPAGMDEAAKNSTRSYTIASRCGVFAKSDIQPLLNQGAKIEDVSVSIFQAVVNQTIAGLAQGRPIKGNVLYLGGPITFLSQLRACFDRSLGIEGTLPEDSLYYVAIGAALYGQGECTLDQAIAALEKYSAAADYNAELPLFADMAEYEEFRARHAAATAPRGELKDWDGPVYIGVDAGSTTVKVAVIDGEGTLLYSDYRSNSGNPITIVKAVLEDIYRQKPDINIAACAATGYGEEIVKNAFSLDMGVVETMAHFTAAKHFMPDVDFVIDIGGQDMKCFKIEDGAVSDIYLNEACSSGCGSFLQTFAEALGYTAPEFAKLGLKADRPVDLGSRCTVFMNSSVKQAQKDGASIENISAGLSMSVVKNAIYKVIRAASPEELGRHIVVQGGTFLNEAVLRAFEKEMGVPVVRPDIAGLMGAYGAALWAMDKGPEHSSVITPEGLAKFSYEMKQTTCGGCGNKCRLTISTFEGGRRFISGNRCERPVKGHSGGELNMMDYKRGLLDSYKPVPGPRGRIGIPMGLNMYELLPFWHAFFTKLGFEVVTSPASDRKLYISGQDTIPSDTVCFPAKLIHGHINALAEDDSIDAIFYPCLTYNVDEHTGDNNFNCPVVAYYPEVIYANCPKVREKTFIYDYVGIHRRSDFQRKIPAILGKYFSGLGRREINAAVAAAYESYARHMEKIRQKGAEMIAEAREKNTPIVILCGRPYHIDPEINHGIDRLITSKGAALITEDAVSHLVPKQEVAVLNQWTYHSRLYNAAKYVTTQPDMELVQLVSFGCGVDAITTDEVKSILHSAGRIYTQIKIDEITNLGAVNIRLRSLFAAVGKETR